MDKLKGILTKNSNKAAELPDKFFERVASMNPNQKWLYSEDIPVYTGTGDIDNPKSWRRICQEDLIDVQLVYEEEPKYGYLFYTNDGFFYYSLRPQIFNDYSEVFAGEFLDKM